MNVGIAQIKMDPAGSINSVRWEDRKGRKTPNGGNTTFTQDFRNHRISHIVRKDHKRMGRKTLVLLLPLPHPIGQKHPPYLLDAYTKLIFRFPRGVNHHTVLGAATKQPSVATINDTRVVVFFRRKEEVEEIVQHRVDFVGSLLPHHHLRRNLKGRLAGKVEVAAALHFPALGL